MRGRRQIQLLPHYRICAPSHALMRSIEIINITIMPLYTTMLHYFKFTSYLNTYCQLPRTWMLANSQAVHHKSLLIHATMLMIWYKWHWMSSKLGLLPLFSTAQLLVAYNTPLAPYKRTLWNRCARIRSKLINVAHIIVCYTSYTLCSQFINTVYRSNIALTTPR